MTLAEFLALVGLYAIAYAFVSISISLTKLVMGKSLQIKAAKEVAYEMGTDYAVEPVETGLYHPTFSATEDSLSRRAEAERLERFDPTEDWGKTSVFDVEPDDGFPAGVYRSG